MSTTADIVDGITRLVTALNELLETETMKELANAARQFGIGGPVKTGLQALGKVLDLIDGWIAKLEQVAEIPALLDSLEPAFDGLASLSENSGEELQQMGLDALAPLADAARAAVGVLDKLRRGAASVLRGLLPKESLAQLRAALRELAATLKERQAQLDAPAPAQSGSTLPALAGGAA